MPRNYAIGVDFGGTKLLASMVDVDSGKVVSSAKVKSDPNDSSEDLMNRVYGAIDAAIKDAGSAKKFPVSGIGVGIAGQVDSEKGILLGAPNLSKATVDLPIAKLLTKRYKIPTWLLNDVQIAALGESAFGAGSETDNFLCVFVGTGVGGAVVHRGELVRGASGSAGEIGHITVDVNGRYCGCGGRGHLEAYASRTAMTTAIVNGLRHGAKSKITKLIPELKSGDTSVAIRSGMLKKALNEKDELITEVIEEAGYYLGVGLASAINLLNPPLIVLGGGVIESVDRLFELAGSRARADAIQTSSGAVKIVKAKLGDDAGVVGAAVHAYKEASGD